MSRLWVIALLLVLTAGAAPPPAVTPSGFTTLGTALQLASSETLTLTLTEEASNGTAVSQPFLVVPSTVYALTIDATLDRGVVLTPSFEVQTAGGTEWRPLVPSRSKDRWLLATLPTSRQVRLVLQLAVPGMALGRSARIASCRLEPIDVLQFTQGLNSYWDESFERSPSFTGEIDFWTHLPTIAELRQGDALNGAQFLHIETDAGLYIVMPTTHVRPLRLYRFTCHVRGEGTIIPGMHKLGLPEVDEVSLDSASRIGRGNALVSRIELQADHWQEVVILAATESDDVRFLQPYFSITSDSWIDIDVLSLTPIPVHAAGPSSIESDGQPR